jgi:hypothetical protein
MPGAGRVEVEQCRFERPAIRPVQRAAAANPGDDHEYGEELFDAPMTIT